MSFSPEKLFIVGLIALVVLGPNRLPEAARTFGRFVATVRRLSSGVQAELRDVLAEPADAFSEARGDFRPSSVRWSVRETISSTWHPPTPRVDERPEDGSSAPPPPSESSDCSATLGPPDDPSLN